jgi:hypothetical protein
MHASFRLMKRIKMVLMEFKKGSSSVASLFPYPSIYIFHVYLHPKKVSILTRSIWNGIKRKSAGTLKQKR